MSQPQWQLAQINIARMRAPLDDPTMVGFVSRLDAINALAEASPGFVWRFQGEAGNATYLRPYDDDRIIINMSVWESVDALRAYVYQADHAAVMRQRKDWFEKFDGPYLALWWVPFGHRPGIDEAKVRLDHLRLHGPSAWAFTVRETFAPEAA
jgi:hypothetical protein